MADFAKNSLICNKNVADKILIRKDDKMVLDFETIDKMPEKFHYDKYMSSEKIKWLDAHWGCQSNALNCNVQFNEKDNTFTINFETCYGIPRRIIEKIAEISNEDNFIWISIYEPSNWLEIFTKNENNRLIRHGMEHEIDYYAENAYEMMKNYLQTENNSKKR